jgi:hypothetical protein
MHDAVEILHGVQEIFTAKPELRAYFYDGKPCPNRGSRRASLMNIAEMLADGIDFGLMVIDLMPGTEEYDGWRDYALSIMQTSPTLKELINEHPEWYLAYGKLIAKSSSPAKTSRR